MRGFAMIIDRRGSRGKPAAEATVDVRRLNARFGEDLLRPFAVTAGDEAQSLTRSAEALVQLVIDSSDHGLWWVGVGVGDVEEPLPPTVNTARGEAFYLARTAVERAKSVEAGTVVLGDDLLDDAVTTLSLVAARRSDSQYETVDLARRGMRQADIADEMGITQQAVSKRLATAGWEMENRLRRVCVALAEAALRP